MLTNGAKTKRAIGWFIAAIVVAGILMVTGGDLQTLAASYSIGPFRETVSPTPAMARSGATPALSATPVAQSSATPLQTPTASPSASPTRTAAATPSATPTAKPATSAAAQADALSGDTISVQGVAAVLFDLNSAYINIDASIEGDNVNQAYTRANDLAAQLLEEASGWGVTLADVQWQDMQLVQGTKPTLRMALRLQIRDLTKLNAALTYLMQQRLLKDASLGEVTVGTAQDAALKAAMEDAYARAQVLAEASGGVCGGVLAVEVLDSPDVPDGYAGAAVHVIYAFKEADAT